MLTEDQLNAFERDGFIVVENVLDAKTVIEPIVQQYTQKLNALSAQWHAQGELPEGVDTLAFNESIRAIYKAGLDYFQPLDISLPPGQITQNTPMFASSAVFDLMINDGLLDIVEQLIGPEITSNPIQHVRIKPPVRELSDEEDRAHITYTAWHQDRAVTLAEADATRMVTTWVAISDATAENGCLQVVPGSHKGDMLLHCPAGQLSIPAQMFDLESAVPVPVKSGGVVIFHPLTVHGSLENHTNDIRWSFDLRFNVTGDPTGRSFFPDFIARSRQAPETELRDAGKWAQMWMDARAELSGAGDVQIHRWDGTANLCA